MGDATRRFASSFTINLGDPLVKRIQAPNPTVEGTPFDAGLGKVVLADPAKKIFKVIPTDFNNDGKNDLVIAYDDGTIKLLKNY